MAHFSKVLNNVVINCIVAEPEFFETFVDTEPGEWIQTSYNTYGGVHYVPNSNRTAVSEDQSKALRKNFGGIGMIYDRENDAFHEAKPYPSWTLNPTTYMWENPIPKPDDGKPYIWNEENKVWDPVTDINLTS